MRDSTDKPSGWNDFFASSERAPEKYMDERADDPARARKELIALFGTVGFDPDYDYKAARHR